jgi:hypothetical protein
MGMVFKGDTVTKDLNKIVWDPEGYYSLSVKEKRVIVEWQLEEYRAALNDPKYSSIATTLQNGVTLLEKELAHLNSKPEISVKQPTLGDFSSKETVPLFNVALKVLMCVFLGYCIFILLT